MGLGCKAAAWYHVRDAVAIGEASRVSSPRPLQARFLDEKRFPPEDELADEEQEREGALL